MEVVLSFRDTLEVDCEDGLWEVRLCRPRGVYIDCSSYSLELAVALALSGTRYDVDRVLDRIPVAA